MIRLYELRTEMGASQREIAKRMNVSQATYYNWENGKTQPSIEQLIAFADLFDVSVDYLIGRTEEGFNPPSTGNELVNSFLALDQESREAIRVILQRLAESE